MIDVIFLLLIFFFVAAKWRPQESFLPFQLPAAQAQSLRIGKPEPLLIRIFAAEAGCEVKIAHHQPIRIADQTIERDLISLMEKINQSLIAQKRFTCDPIEIICSPQVKWDHVAKIYNVFFGAGLTDITFAMTQ